MQIYSHTINLLLLNSASLIDALNNTIIYINIPSTVGIICLNDLGCFSKYFPLGYKVELKIAVFDLSVF